MRNSCQGLEGRPIEPSNTAQGVGPLGLCLVLTIAYRGSSAPALKVSASAGLFASRVASGTHRRVHSIPISEYQHFPTPDTFGTRQH